MKNTLLLIGLIIAAVVLGALLATLTADTDAFNWLSYSKGFSISPTEINLVVCKFTFGIDFSMNIAQVLFIIASIFAYPKMKKLIG